MSLWLLLHLTGADSGPFLSLSPRTDLGAALDGVGGGSLRRKIAMHVNPGVHRSNKLWQWMLSDFKHPLPPADCLTPPVQHMAGGEPKLRQDDGTTLKPQEASCESG
ncbi:unnamed protein product [Pleuronectes platessa]|uniref:Uncharacterized protein n=1 Tax=Pleuronectes platessa TaxID=8262 RepID=A0A9N7YMW0_PLEPL|nr:unnamed protein product [Pleuronectes platessa]